MKELNLVKTDSELQAIIKATWDDFETNKVDRKRYSEMHEGREYDPADWYDFVCGEMLEQMPFLASLVYDREQIDYVSPPPRQTYSNQRPPAAKEAPRMNY